MVGNVIEKQIKCHTNFQKKNSIGRPSSFITEHETYIRELLDEGFPPPSFILKIAAISYLKNLWAFLFSKHNLIIT